jgi:transposase
VDPTAGVPHWEGVMNAVTSEMTNARAEPIKSRVQWVKRMGCGFRNQDNFRNAIYFHLGGLDLYPEALKSTHSKA